MTEGISIVLITYNKGATLRKSLEHIYRHRDAFREVVLVDNGSSDRTFEMVRREFPNVEVSRLEKNVGVPAGRNVGAAKARCDLLFFYDDDGRFDFSALPAVIELLRTRDEIAVATFEVVNLPADDIFALEMAAYRTAHRESRYVPVFKGGASIIKRDVFIKVGMYPDYFFYCREENDLSYRLFRNGYRIIHCGNAVMLHKKVVDRSALARRFYYHYRNRVFEMMRNLPLLEAATGTVRLAVSGLVGAVLTGGVAPFVKGFGAGLIGVPRVLWSERDPLSREQFREYRTTFRSDIGLAAKLEGLRNFVRLWRRGKERT